MSVTVLNIDGDVVVVHDIGESLAPGSQATIADDKALRSTDLWRAISQRRLYQLKTEIAIAPSPTPNKPAPANLQKPPSLSDVLSRLDTIIGLLRELPLSTQAPPTQPSLRSRTPRSEEEAAPAPAPLFLPTLTTPESSRVQGEGLAKEGGGSSSVTENASRLRALRNLQ